LEREVGEQTRGDKVRKKEVEMVRSRRKNGGGVGIKGIPKE
jgi:hypothetical protein